MLDTTSASAPEPLCHCGRPLHYTDPQIRALIEGLIAVSGPVMPISVAGRTWLVQRHYIALHGLKASELPNLGFPELLRTAGSARRVDRVVVCPYCRRVACVPEDFAAQEAHMTSVHADVVAQRLAAAEHLKGWADDPKLP